MSVVQGDAVTMADLLALNYTILIPYNASIPTGGDSLVDNLNLYYTVGAPSRKWRCRLSALSWPATGDGSNTQSGDLAWIMTSSALVLLMIPGVGWGIRRSFFWFWYCPSNKASGLLLASFIPDSPEESRRCRLSGSLSYQPLSLASSGSSGASPWPFHMTLASSLATSTTSGSGMFSLGLRSEAPKSPTCYSPSTNACSPPLRE